MTNFRPCDDCTICCQGWVAGNAYGSKFYPGKKCDFLVTNKCTIYPARPSMCKNYQCAWTQHLLPEWMRPDKSKILVSVQDWTKGQYLLATNVEESPFSKEAIEELEKFCTTNNCPCVMVEGKDIKIKGSEEFKEFYKYKNKIFQI